jgi:FHA domain
VARPFAVELNDRAVSFARDGQVVSIAPSAVWDGNTDELAGTNAWHALRRHPTATSTRHLGALLSQSVVNDRSVALVAAELARRLAAQPPTAGESVWMVSPARASESGLGAVLAIARTLALSVDGFVDSGVASVAALGIEGPAVVLELGLHHAAATSMDRDGAHVRRRRTVATERGGLMGFYQAWLELVRTAMVRQTRFDPLHDAATEQYLFDALGTWARQAALAGSVRAAVTQGAQRFEVALTRDQFSRAARTPCHEIARLLHELRPAGAPITLVVPSAIAELPGLRDELEQFVDCELVSLPDGFAAAATSRLELPERSREEPVRLLRRLPAQSQSVSGDVTRATLDSKGTRSTPPSHLLLEGQVHALAGDPLVLGRSPAGSRTLALPDGIAGVSRRHCTLIPQASEVVLLDHSRFGTFVNGERVMERARIRVGDRVRLGDPGIELAFIAVSEAPDVA